MIDRNGPWPGEPICTSRPRTVEPTPSLHTPCATMAERGDSLPAATWIVDRR